MLTDRIKDDVLADVNKSTQSNNYGWSTSGVQLIQQAYDLHQNKIISKGKFQNEEMVLKLWHKILGNTIA